MNSEQNLKSVHCIENHFLELKSTQELEQAIDDYLNWMISNDYTQSTVEIYQSILNKFVSYSKIMVVGAI